MAPRSLDHVVVAVDDLDETAGELISLGFHVTDRSDHPFGTSNRLVVLENSYIEIASVTDPGLIPDTGFARFLADALAAGRSGPLMVALSTDDPQRDARRVAAA
ncbi:MAG: VOC family protein, partial [Acidimicrobiia bacterium]